MVMAATVFLPAFSPQKLREQTAEAQFSFRARSESTLSVSPHMLGVLLGSLRNAIRVFTVAHTH